MEMRKARVSIRECCEGSPFVPLALCLAAGIASAGLVETYSFAALGTAAAAVICTAGAALARNRTNICFLFGLLAVVLGGLLLRLAERDGYAGGDVRAMVATGELPLSEPILIDGCVLEDGARRGADIVTTVALRGLRRQEAWAACTGKIELHVAALDDPQLPRAEVRAGDRVRAWVSCDRPRNFENPGSGDRVGFLARRGIFLLARARSPRLIEVLPADCGTPWERAAAAVRRWMRERLRDFGTQVDPQQAAVLSSILLGDSTDLGSAVRNDFQNAGTYHVLVVSGLHVSWIAWVLTRLFRMTGMPPSLVPVPATIGIMFYACMVGFQASISRALWMFALVLAGHCVFRRASPANTVFACGFLLLCARPSWLLDIGFQLSFLAVCAIVLMGLPFLQHVVQPLFDPLRHAGDQERLYLQADPWHARGRRLRFSCEMLVEACADRCFSGLGGPGVTACRAAAACGLAAAGMIVVSLAVQTWLEPILAYYFNRLSWVGPAANLAIVPLASLVLAAGMAAEVWAGLAHSASLFRIAGFAASALLAANRWFTDLPGAWQRCPTPAGIWVLAGVILILLWCLLRPLRFWIPCLLVGLELLCLSLVESGILPASRVPFRPADSRGAPISRLPALRIFFLDVGQGDSIGVQFPDGLVWVIDAGGLHPAQPGPPDEDAFDIGEAVVSRFYWSRWVVALDRVILTHPHRDHAGGIPALLRNFPAGRLDYAEGAEDPSRAEILRQARAAGVPVHAAVAGEKCEVAGVSVRVLNPPRGRPFRSINDGSLAIRLEFGRFSALLAGDMEGPAETAAAMPSLLLKVGHHGSRNATLDPFLEQVRPRWAVISVGRKNPFGNPSAETLQRLLRHRARILVTADLGAISFETDGSRYRISSHTLGILEQGVL